MVKPMMIVSDPDPTCQVITDPDPTCQVISDPDPDKQRSFGSGGIRIRNSDWNFEVADKGSPAWHSSRWRWGSKCCCRGPHCLPAPPATTTQTFSKNFSLLADF